MGIPVALANLMNSSSGSLRGLRPNHPSGGQRDGGQVDVAVAEQVDVGAEAVEVGCSRQDGQLTTDSCSQTHPAFRLLYLHF